MNIILSCTKDYSLFDLYEDNRVITETSVNKMVATLKKKNLLSCFPLVVYKKNGVLYITDGQRRFLAAKQLGLKVYYIINNQCTKEDIPYINSSQEAWKMTHYLHSFVIKAQCSNRGAYSDYLRLNDFIKTYRFSISNALQMLAGYEGSDITANFKKGKFKINNYPKACETAKNINEFKPLHKHWNTRFFIRALSKLTRNPKYDQVNMMKKMQTLHHTLLHWHTSAHYIANMETIYNHKKQNKTRFVEVGA